MSSKYSIAPDVKIEHIIITDKPNVMTITTDDDGPDDVQTFVLNSTTVEHYLGAVAKHLKRQFERENV